ncbi:MAG TPA: hypothetical protein VLJ86_00440 [Ramlibacter sp.]|nr:hypothetical protein [Ramlibacter sp.]
MQVSTGGSASASKGAAEARAATPGAADVAAALGRGLADPLRLMRTTLQDVRERKSFGEVDLALLEQALEQAHRISLCSQQIARLAAGRLHQSHEKLALHEVLAEVLASRQPAWQAHGVEVRQVIKPVEVIVDPGLLVGLIEASLDWAVEQGAHIVVKLEMKNWPEHGLLTVSTERHADAPDPDSLWWLLLAQTAEAMEVLPQRVEEDGRLTATLEFSRTVGRLTALSAMEVDDGVRPGPSTWQTDSQSPQGVASNRILLITNDHGLQREVTDICKLMDLKVFCTPNTEQGIRFTELSCPRVILLDESVHDNIFDRWRAELAHSGAPIPMLEITDDGNSAFMVSAWDSDNLSSIGRDVLGRKLIDAITTEMQRG